MSSHREAPESSKDPVADNTDVYAFVSPDRPDTVTLIANYLPFQYPAGGPNFYEFGDDVSYRIKVDNDGTGRSSITYEFQFETMIKNKNTFLYNTGQITSLQDEHFNRPQKFKVFRWIDGEPELLGENMICPPCNVGERSIPNYPALANSAIYTIGDGIKVFAGQRLEGFYVDVGSVFDLAVLRPFQNLHLIPTPAKPGVNGTRAFNVHTLALQIPINQLTRDGSRPTDYKDRDAVIGVWATANRRRGRLRLEEVDLQAGPYQQVSRLANPLFNEVIIPMAQKDQWNRDKPIRDSEYTPLVERPELAKLLVLLYPDVFPNLAELNNDPDGDRAELVAILLTGLPDGLIPGFQNYTGTVLADMVRLNVAIPPAADPEINGIIGGDLAGFPNGRRVFDNVVAIELRVIAGLLYPLIDPDYAPDDAAGLLYDVTPGDKIPSSVSYLDVFPYLDHPVSGFDVIPPKKGAATAVGAV